MGAISMAVVLAALITAWWNGAFASRITDISVVSLAPVRNDDACPAGDCSKSLELRFQSGVSLRKLIRDTDAGVGLFQIGFCPYDDGQSLGNSMIYHNGIDVSTSPGSYCVWQNDRLEGCKTTDDTPAVRAEVNAINARGPFLYSAYFEYRAISHFDEAQHTFVDRPVPKKSPDLCFRVFAPPGELRPTPFASSTVRIPGGVVRKALQELEAKQFGPQAN
jgi:hypothetical protein